MGVGLHNWRGGRLRTTKIGGVGGMIPNSVSSGVRNSKYRRTVGVPTPLGGYPLPTPREILKPLTPTPLFF